MKKLFFCFILILAIGMVVSCSVRKPLPPMVIENTKEIIQTIRDTIYKVEADSSYYEAYIDCINGKPVIRETPQTKLNTKPGRTLQKPKATISGNKLNVDCYKNIEELHKQWEETYIKEHEQTPIYVDVPVEVEKPLTWFQKLQIWLGRIFLGIISLGVLLLILRWKRIV